MRAKRGTGVPPSPYRYRGYYIDDMINDLNWVPAHVQCEEEGDHEFWTKTWPPPFKNGQATTLSGRCKLCGVNLDVEAGHGAGTIQGIVVYVNGTRLTPPAEPADSEVDSEVTVKRGPGRPRKESFAV